MPTRVVDACLCYGNVRWIQVDADESEALEYCGFAGAAAAHEWVEHESAGRRHEAAQVPHQVSGLHRWVEVALARGQKLLGIAQHVPNAENRKIRLVGQPVTLSRTPSRMAARPPEVGEQTDEILGEFGFSAGEISALRKEKVV